MLSHLCVSNVLHGERGRARGQPTQSAVVTKKGRERCLGVHQLSCRAQGVDAMHRSVALRPQVLQHIAHVPIIEENIQSIYKKGDDEKNLQMKNKTRRLRLRK